MKFQIISIILLILFSGILRFYKMDSNPPGLYIDEVSIAYNASSILSTGKDEFGKIFPLYFQAYGEYKLPVYIYLSSLSMAIFGKTDFAVRFPSAIAGIATVVVLYSLLEILEKLDDRKIASKKRKWLPLVGAGLLAITPWHIQFSRGGFEANVALFVFLLSVFFFFKTVLGKKNSYFIITLVLLVTSLYTYSTYRIIAPLAILGMGGYLFHLKIFSLKKIIINLCIFGLLCLPIFSFSFSQNGQVRFLQTAAFSEYPVTTESKKLIVYPLVFIKNYITFYSPAFLFSHGDGIGRHQLPNWGPLYRTELVLIVLGITSFVKSKRFFLLGCTLALFFLAPIPAALARPSPHTLRSLLLVIPFTILAASGLLFLTKKKIMFFAVILIGAFEMSLYLHTFYEHYPKTNSLDWGAGYKGMAEIATNYQQKNYQIYIDKNLGSAPIYLKFYSPNVRYTMVDVSWGDKKHYKSGQSVWIRPYYGKNDSESIAETVYLPSVNNDIFAQFWKL